MPPYDVDSLFTLLDPSIKEHSIYSKVYSRCRHRKKRLLYLCLSLDILQAVQDNDTAALNRQLKDELFSNMAHDEPPFANLLQPGQVHCHPRSAEFSAAC